MANKPGEMALKAMKESNNKLVQFKTPNIPQKRKSKMKILNEEQYIEVRNFYNLIKTNSK